MTPKKTTIVRGLLLAGITLILLSSVVLAFTGDPAINWFTIDGGGSTSTGGDFTLSGTIGQPDAGPLMSSGEYSLAGGFWSGVSPPASFNSVYIPLVMK